MWYVEQTAKFQNTKYLNNHYTSYMTIKIDFGERQFPTPIMADGLCALMLKDTWKAMAVLYPGLDAPIVYNGKLHKYMKEFKTRGNRYGWAGKTYSERCDVTLEWAYTATTCYEQPKLFVSRWGRVASDGNKASVERDLAFRFPANLIDGIGVLKFMNRFSRLVDEHPIGSGGNLSDKMRPGWFSRLTPSYSELFNVPHQPSDALAKKIHEAQLLDQAQQESTVNTLILPCIRTASRPSAPNRKTFFMPVHSTKMLLENCKSVGVTVTELFHAAVAMHLAELQPRWLVARRLNFSTRLMRDERRFCREMQERRRREGQSSHNIFDIEDPDVGIYHTMAINKFTVQVEVPAATQSKDEWNASFRNRMATLLGTIKAGYKEFKEDPDLHSESPWIMCMHRGTKGQRLNPQQPPVPHIPPFFITSTGRTEEILARRHGKVEVFQPWIASDRMDNGYNMTLGTFRGQLSVNISYNNAWHSEQSVSEFYMSCCQVITRLFGLKVFEQGVDEANESSSVEEECIKEVSEREAESKVEDAEEGAKGGGDDSEQCTSMGKCDQKSIGRSVGEDAKPVDEGAGGVASDDDLQCKTEKSDEGSEESDEKSDEESEESEEKSDEGSIYKGEAEDDSEDEGMEG